MDTQDIESLQKKNAELVLALQAVAAEITPGVRPTSTDSYLPPAVADMVLAVLGDLPRPTATNAGRQTKMDALREQYWDFKEGRDYGTTDPFVMALCDKAAWEAWKGHADLVAPGAADATRQPLCADPHCMLHAEAGSEYCCNHLSEHVLERDRDDIAD